MHLYLLLSCRSGPCFLLQRLFFLMLRPVVVLGEGLECVVEKLLLLQLASLF